MSIKEKNKRGRPIGYRLSKESKDAISRSKEGQSHTQETKDKISRSLVLYFKNLKPLSEEIINRYCRVGDDLTCGWVNDVRTKLDKLDDVLTDRIMRNKNRMELTCGNNIEYFGHCVTPESLVLFKEVCELCGVNPMEFFDQLS